jgi:hypothetical protein
MSVVTFRHDLLVLRDYINSLENELELLENGSLDDNLSVCLNSSFDLSQIGFKFQFPSVPVLIQGGKNCAVDFETNIDFDPLESKDRLDVVNNENIDALSIPQGHSKKRHRSLSTTSLKTNMTSDDKTDDENVIMKDKAILSTSDVDSLDDELSVTATSPHVAKTYGKSSGSQRRTNVVRAESPSVLDPPHSAEFTPKRSSRLSKK